MGFRAAVLQTRPNTARLPPVFAAVYLSNILDINKSWQDVQLQNTRTLADFKWFTSRKKVEADMSQSFDYFPSEPHCISFAVGYPNTTGSVVWGVRIKLLHP